MLPMGELTLCLDPALWTPFAYLLISVGLNLVRHSEYHLFDPKCTSRIQIVCNTVWTTIVVINSIITHMLGLIIFNWEHLLGFHPRK